MMYCDLGSLMQKNGLGTKLPIHETKNWKFHENISHKMKMVHLAMLSFKVQILNTDKEQWNMHKIYNSNKASSAHKAAKMMIYSTEWDLMKCFLVFQSKTNQNVRSKIAQK